MIDVFIVAEIKLFREGLAQALERTDALHVVATAARLNLLGAWVNARPGTVLLLDVATGHAIDSLPTLKFTNPELRVVALGVTECESEIVAWAEAGVSAYLTRDGSIADLIATIMSVARNELTCAPCIAAALIRRVHLLAADRRMTVLENRLSRRELEIVLLVAEGMSNKEIASRLVITLATVKNHVHSILEKLKVHTRTEAATWARRHELNVTPPRDGIHMSTLRRGTATAARSLDDVAASREPESL